MISSQTSPYFVTMSLESGVSIRTLQGWLGHITTMSRANLGLAKFRQVALKTNQDANVRYRQAISRRVRRFTECGRSGLSGQGGWRSSLRFHGQPDSQV